MPSFRKPDGSYNFDLSRSENLAATFLSVFRAEKLEIFSVQESDTGITLLVGDTGKDVPLDSLFADVELSIPVEFYGKAVTSDYADEILSLAPDLSGLDEFSKLFSYAGALLGTQLALISNGLYDNDGKLVSERLAEVLAATFKFQDAFKVAYKNFLIEQGLAGEDFLTKDHQFLDGDVLSNLLNDLTRGPGGMMVEEVKNRFPIVFALSYYSLFQTLAGAVLAIISSMGQSVKVVLQIGQNVSAANVIGALANSQSDLFKDDTGKLGLSEPKKILFGLLVVFHRMHQYIETFTGYTLNDPVAQALALWGKTLYEAETSDVTDDYYINRGVLNVGREYGIDIESLTEIAHPLVGYNSIGAHHLLGDSTLPFAVVSAVFLALKNVDAPERFHKNAFNRVIDISSAADKSSVPAAELIHMVTRTIVADAQSGADEVDTVRLYKVAAAAAALALLPGDDAKTGRVIADNYLSALYIQWFKSGKFFRTTRYIAGGGLDAYHELHKEALMVVSQYQEFVSSTGVKGMSPASISSYQLNAMNNLAFNWIFKVPGEPAYIQSFASSLLNIVIVGSNPEDVARAIMAAALSPIAVEVLGLTDSDLSLISVVERYDHTVSAPNKSQDLESLKKFPIAKSDLLQDLFQVVSGSEMEKRCFILGGVASSLNGILPLDFATYFVATPIETLLQGWSSKQSVFVDSASILPGDEVKLLEIRTTFLEGGTINRLVKEVADFNPLIK